jgi:hypothetical protein
MCLTIISSALVPVSKVTAVSLFPRTCLTDSSYLHLQLFPYSQWHVLPTALPYIYMFILSSEASAIHQHVEFLQITGLILLPNRPYKAASVV